MLETLKTDKFQWIHILNPSDEDLLLLKDKFGFHPLDIEDCKTKKQRPKIDVYDSYYFIIVHFPWYDKTNTFLGTKEIKIFWGKDFFVTIGHSHWLVRDMFQRAQEDEHFFASIFQGSSDKLLYFLIEKMLKETHSIINRIGSEVDYLNRSLFGKHAYKIIEKISITRKNIILLNTTFKPQLRLFHKFESGEIAGFTENMEDYWGNILDSHQRIWDLIEDYEELIIGLSKTFDSLQANRMNEIIRVLTFFSSIMLPLTFVTGMYGMNIKLPFQDSHSAFLIVVGIMLAITIVLLLFFKKRGWI
ncbi:MAG: hypothetical protein A2X12_05070 [Bacteroidetes bacterium GWE2_29_8]|nr:MAG: hypothetical protein A2X12_05070 [Bacteroidetes bacterium GWE2_29_8]